MVSRMGTIAAIALAATVAIAGTSVGTASAQGDGSPKQQYMVYCAKCHGPGGHGDGANASTLKTRPRDFSDCKLMKTISDDTMFKAIKNGGPAVNLPGDMPPWGQAFEDSEIKGLVSFVRTFCKK